MTITLITEDPADNIVFKTGALHGWPLEQGAQRAVRSVYFWSTHQSLHQIGDLMSQTIMIQCLLNDAEWLTPIEVFDYLDELNKLTGTPGNLNVTINAHERIINNVFFASWQPLIPAPLPNGIPAPIGPQGNYFHEVMLYFQRVKF